MSFMKKQAAGFWASIITLILVVVSIAIYYVNIGSEGYFQGAAVTNAMNYFLLTAAMLVVVLILTQLSLNSGAEKIVSLISDAMRIAAPVCLTAGLMYLLSNRIEGFAFIYFSNEEVLQEVQTAANMSSSSCAIANIVVLALAVICGIVAAFFSMKKKV